MTTADLPSGQDGPQPPDELRARLIDVAARMRAGRPLVHYIPNLVTAADAANALLAAGAAPVMAVATEEVGVIPSAALVLNLGTPTADRVTLLERAGRAALARRVPVVLDPVGAGATPFRLVSARHLLALPPTVVRLNAGEAAALLGTGAPRGVDAAEPAADTVALAVALAQRYGVVAAVTGATDAVSDGRRSLTVANGHPLLARLTGAGCMVSGIVGACAAVEPDAVLAAAAGLLLFGVAGELACREATGPGTARVRLFDWLAECDDTTLEQEGRVAWQ